MSNFDGQGEPGGEMEDHDVELLLEQMRSRIGDTEQYLDSPPVGVWDSIDAALAVDEVAGPTDGLQRAESNVTLLDHHRRRRRPGGALLAAVAASVVAAVVIGAIVRSNARIIAEVDLAGIDDDRSFGRATVVAEDGETRLEVDLSEDLSADGSFYELWVIDPEVEQMHSLGAISTDATFELPDGVVVNDFPIIDISLEPNDGDAAHSGNSVCRGIVDT